MFKCCECGSEYKTKPDFCDCGNDSFREIPDEVEISKPVKKKSFNEQYPELSSFMKTMDPISVIIFCICIILSVSALIFIKPSEQEVTENSVTTKTVANIKVADINSFWDDTPPVKSETVKEVQENQTIVEKFMDIIPKQEPQKTPQTVAQAPQKQQQITQKPKQTQKPQQVQKTQQTAKPQPKQNTQTTVQKPSQQKPSAQKPVQNTQKPSQQTSKPSQQTQTVQQQSQKTPQTSTPAQQTKQQTTTATTQQTTQPQTVQQQTKSVDNSAAYKEQLAKELKNYKNGLRNILFSKMNFTNIYGNGTCTVDFQINSSGKLINRKFSKQSPNNTLNDEVYSAIINTPVYKTPPSSYTGQILHFTVKFSEGQYEVSLY